MKLTTVRFLFIGALVSLSMTGCKKDRAEEQQSDARDLNAELRAVLEESSGGEGLQHYVLPESYQYSLIPQDPLNPMTSIKVELGKLLFHETGIGLNPKLADEGLQTYSCASCHHAQGGFQANMRQGIGEGGIGFGMAGEGRSAHPAYPPDSIDVQPIRTPTVMNGAYQEVMLWNGRLGATGPNVGTEDQWSPGTPLFNNNFGHHGLETQVIAGFSEHRLVVDEQVCQDYGMYQDLFDIAFPDWPEATRYTARTAAMAIAAYERTILSNQAPWQDWLRGNTSAMSDSEKRGAIAFFGKAECGSCHNGPALNSMSFHALGMEDLTGADVVNGNDNDLGRGGFTQNPEDMYKFKTPQLYNLKDSPFYGHGGNFNSVREVIEYKNNAVPQNINVPETQLAEEFHPLGLTESEIDDLTNFIEYALYDANLMRYVPGNVPSGNCFPNADAISIIDQGCME